MVSSRNFIVLHFTTRSTVHLEMNFLYKVGGHCFLYGYPRDRALLQSHSFPLYCTDTFVITPETGYVWYLVWLHIMYTFSLFSWSAFLGINFINFFQRTKFWSYFFMVWLFSSVSLISAPIIFLSSYFLWAYIGLF